MIDRTDFIGSQRMIVNLQFINGSVVRLSGVNAIARAGTEIHVARRPFFQKSRWIGRSRLHPIRDGKIVRSEITDGIAEADRRAATVELHGIVRYATYMSHIAGNRAVIGTRVVVSQAA